MSGPILGDLSKNLTIMDLHVDCKLDVEDSRCDRVSRISILFYVWRRMQTVVASALAEPASPARRGGRARAAPKREAVPEPEETVVPAKKARGKKAAAAPAETVKTEAAPEVEDEQEPGPSKRARRQPTTSAAGAAAKKQDSTRQTAGRKASVEADPDSDNESIASRSHRNPRHRKAQAVAVSQGGG